MNRGDGAKEKLRPGRIRAGKIRMVHRARLGRVQSGDRGIVGYHNVGVVAEPLQAAIPNIAANVVIGARRYREKRYVPDCGQPESYDDGALGKGWGAK